MRSGGLHHVAMAVADLERAVDVYTRLFGAEVELRGRIEDQGVDAVYLLVGEGRVELVSPLAPDTPVGRFLERRGPGMHHVAFEVDDLGAAIAALEREGADVIDRQPRPGLAGHDVSFVHPDSVEGVLLEIAFAGGQTIGPLVAPAAADELASALAGTGDGAFELEAEDGRYVIPLRGVLYLKRFSRDSQIGFGRVG